MMAFFRSLPVAVKLLSVLGLLASVAVGLLVSTHIAFDRSRERTDELLRNARVVELASMSVGHALAFARAVEFLPIEMPEAQRGMFENQAAEELKALHQTLGELERRITTPESKADVAAARRALMPYEAAYPKVADLSRKSDFDAGGKLIFEIGPQIDALRREIIKVQNRNLHRAIELGKQGEEAFSSTKLMLWVAGLAGILLAFGGGAAVAIGMVGRPLSAIKASMDKLMAGDLDCAVPAARGMDEVGALAKGVAHFKDAARAKRDLEAQQGQAKLAAEVERKATMSMLATEFERSVQGIVTGVAAATEQLRSTADRMKTTADTTTDRAATVVTSADGASSSVQTVAAAAEELSASIAEIARQAGASATAAQGAVSQMHGASSDVEGLTQAAQKIGDVVRLISEIAAQTNLLALNATIEAARA
ncbi:MAG: methyl-accepting chemotaxis protein, partial [Alphaproteobacteria bacterium]|nr:methyl-accepting chemotaxis protein [Alphaproteobacteria bacterium]